MTGLIGGSPPRIKPVHRAKHIDPQGSVSALCFVKPRPIDLARASWTIRPGAVTCKKCARKADVMTRPTDTNSLGDKI